ncbi:hypothetical protein [uncultured Mediterranean phage uvMED]|nr:hypothetical protein [uncultured Mediterranean phage uvMED]BAR19637.1 hypothetical protein [uncultured Mediterranean phage uvMED]
MALSEATVEDKIEVVDCGGWKVIQVRTATIISRDGTEVSRSFHRHVVSPADDWTSASTEVQAMCNTFHTTEAIAAYNAAQSETI